MDKKIFRSDLFATDCHVLAQNDMDLDCTYVYKLLLAKSKQEYISIQVLKSLNLRYGNLTFKKKKKTGNFLISIAFNVIDLPFIIFNVIIVGII